MAEDWLELGRIGSPFGIKGWVHVQSFTDPPERLLKYRDWLVQSDRAEPAAMRVAEGRAHGAGLVARLAGVDDRDRAAQLQGAAIRVARSALPKLKKREFYQVDLIGLAVANVEGVAFGEVAHFVQTPGGSVMVVREPSGKERWVPATREHLRKVDLAARRITVDWPVDLDEGDAEPTTPEGGESAGAAE
ncbi:MAG TPA: ribosome maturation factor RimM [Steroidobacteraceae bacterium]|jgi:16S rRNA processing protein RimM|nr:ribosome maturation factor RimM [Steroidobacteraceae bacterium]